MGCDKGTDDEGCKGEHGEDLPTSDAQDSVCDTSKDHGYGDSIVCGDYMNGASVMLYKDPLRDFANYMGHDLYILPSSIHEVILLLDDEYVQSSEELREMVRETNRIVVDREEILSDHVYYYDREKDEIRIAK